MFNKNKQIKLEDFNENITTLEVSSRYPFVNNTEINDPSLTFYSLESNIIKFKDPNVLEELSVLEESNQTHVDLEELNIGSSHSIEPDEKISFIDSINDITCGNPDIIPEPKIPLLSYTELFYTKFNEVPHKLLECKQFGLDVLAGNITTLDLKNSLIAKIKSTETTKIPYISHDLSGRPTLDSENMAIINASSDEVSKDALLNNVLIKGEDYCHNALLPTLGKERAFSDLCSERNNTIHSILISNTENASLMSFLQSFIVADLDFIAEQLYKIINLFIYGTVSGGSENLKINLLKFQSDLMTSFISLQSGFSKVETINSFVETGKSLEDLKDVSNSKSLSILSNYEPKDSLKLELSKIVDWAFRLTPFACMVAPQLTYLPLFRIIFNSSLGQKGIIATIGLAKKVTITLKTLFMKMTHNKIKL